ncbi:MAG: 50S ribosomal protein L17 [candidate division KSB1 bacterium]|jgi:large subunit ribosomal protein L17|nr:50S ribosomal protein L17 [candidate division KSB1 bacterium]
MRHRRTVKKLGITTSHRKALLANLAMSLVEHKKIKTTVAKAKETRKVVERSITFAKKGTVAARREALKLIRDKEAVRTLFNDIAPQYSDRNGGYTRITKLGQRQGDGASLAYIELVGFEGVKKEKKKEKAESKGKTEKAKTQTAEVEAEKPKAKASKKSKSEKAPEADAEIKK